MIGEFWKDKFLFEIENKIVWCKNRVRYGELRELMGDNFYFFFVVGSNDVC